LSPAFYELSGCGDNKGRKTARGTGAPNFEEVVRNDGGVSKSFESSIVGYEEDGIESAIAQYGRCCAYAMALIVSIAGLRFYTEWLELITYL
jgi:hypothetical protein